MKSLSFSQEHFQLIQNVANLLANRFPKAVRNPRELYYTGYMAVLKAIPYYQTGRGAKVNTFLSTCIYNEMQKEIRKINNVVTLPGKQQSQYSFTSLDNNETIEMNLWEECADDEKQHSLLETLDKLLDQLNPNDKNLIQCRYGFTGVPMTLKELGKAQGVSLQAIQKRLNRIERELRTSIYPQCA